MMPRQIINTYMKARLLIFTSLLIIPGINQGCTTLVNMQPEVPRLGSSEKIPLNVGIYLDQAERARSVTSQYIALGMTSWQFPVGQTLEDMSVSTLSQLFQSVSKTATSMDDQYDLIFEPRIRIFETLYWFDGANTKLAVEYAIRNPKGREVQEGVVSGESNRKGMPSPSETPRHVISRVSEAAFAIVATDLLKQLQRSPVVAKLAKSVETAKQVQLSNHPTSDPPVSSSVQSASAPQQSDVDILPSKAKDFERKDTYAIVIGIGNYREEVIPKIKYAARDAEIVAKYLEQVGGVPRTNIKLLQEDRATLSDFHAYFGEWLTRRVKAGSTVFVYYAGHGAPDPASNEAFLVPYDAHPDFTSKMYPLRSLYETLAKLPAKDVVVMLDSCFSGAGGRSVIKQGARPTVLSVENPLLASEKMIVLAAASGNQISSDYEKVQHGLFTYYLLKGLRGAADRNKNQLVELGELFDYVTANVSEVASIELNRDQTPMLQPGVQLLGSRISIPLAKVGN